MNKARVNFFGIKLTDVIQTNGKNVFKLNELLNNKNLVIISGLKNIGKMNFIKEFIIKTGSRNNYFYFNKSEDTNNTIKSNKELNSLLIDYVRLYKIPKIIILENIEKIEGIKDFISDIYSENHKIILLGNDIKIEGINEIEIMNEYNLNLENLEENLKYGSINEVKQQDTISLKEKYLNILTSDILLNDIFNKFNVKNINLYNFTISYLANNNICISLRELHKNLKTTNNISLKTVIDYIDFSLQSKIIKRVYKFDLKTNKPITSKAKYYFTDNGIRNSLTNFNLETDTLSENLIFNILEYNNYKVFSGCNGMFGFSFYARPHPGIPSLLQEKETAIYIHISKQTTREEIKKEVKKLLKIGTGGKKYLLVESIPKLGIKKRKYDSVEIIEINDFLIKFGK